MTVDVVVPTIGRPSLSVLLDALARCGKPMVRRIVLVDDRRAPETPLLPDGAPPALAGRVTILRGRAAGPAAARNAGWRASDADWIAFLDDDVVPAGGWLAHLRADLEGLAPGIGASQGRIVVPLPADRRPTDWERNVRGLETAQWATADMAYRRAALLAVGGFDERFPRAYREDADLGLRVRQAGWHLVKGRRVVRHPVRPADRWVSLRLQAGNADDVLMRVVHGPGWRARAGVASGRRPRHLAITAAGAAALVALAVRRRAVAALAAAAWLVGTAEFAWARLAPGPWTGDEVRTMLLTSAALPPLASWHFLRGWGSALRTRWTRVGRAPRAVLLDRDGTLVEDVPYNGDPALVRPMPGAREALDRLRAAGVRLAVVSNQSGIGRGLLSPADVAAVNHRVEALLGPLGPWLVCPHTPDTECGCRKPRPGLVLRAAQALGVRPQECVLIGDTGADVDAARAAGARGILVPNAVTRHAEIEDAPEIARDLGEAVDRVLRAA